MRKGARGGRTRAAAWAPRLLAASLALAGGGCAEFSPQVADQRPTYGFTPRAASSAYGKGFYEELCRSGARTDDNGVDCPVFYGLMPAALDDADAARLRLIKAELNESGAPWLATAVGLPVGAYALYRGIFGHGDGARQEIAKLGLAGGATYSWLSARESRSRQSARLAAIEALSCAMYGASARYLYERRHIVGPAPAVAQESRPSPEEDDAPSLARSQSEVRAASSSMRDALYRLNMAISTQPAVILRAGSFNNGCDSGATTTCELRKQVGKPVLSEANAEVMAAGQEAERAKAQLNEVGAALIAARGLRDRIDNAPFDLIRSVKRIEEAGNKAVLATEADVATLRGAVGNLKLGSQTLSSVVAAQVTAPAASSAPAAFEGHASVTVKSTDPKEKAAAEKTRKELAGPRDAVRVASLRLQAALDEVNVHLRADDARAALVRDLDSCQFVNPGLKLTVDPAGPITVEPGSAVRLSALGGSSLPTVTLIGGTGLKAGDVMRVEPDTAEGRQAIGVVLAPATGVADQDVRLVFRNQDLVQVRDVSIRKAGTKK